VLITTTGPEQTTVRPETFRLPKPGESDQFFGFSRSYYYEGEERGYWRLIRIRDKGKGRGVTLIPFEQVAAFVRSQMEDQNG
jgi:hypothetical protein